MSQNQLTSDDACSSINESPNDAILRMEAQVLAGDIELQGVCDERTALQHEVELFMSKIDWMNKEDKAQKHEIKRLKRDNDKLKSISPSKKGPNKTMGVEVNRINDNFANRCSNMHVLNVCPASLYHCRKDGIPFNAAEICDWYRKVFGIVSVANVFWRWQLFCLFNSHWYHILAISFLQYFLEWHSWTIIENINNSDMYTPFNKNRLKESLCNGLKAYVLHQMYYTSFGDLVPQIVVEALELNTIIIHKMGDTNDLDILSPWYSDSLYDRCVMVFKNGLHFDGLC